VWTVAIPVSARAAEPECTIDADTAVASITPADGSVQIDHDGQTISVDGMPCGTLETVDRIDVAPADDQVRIILANGPFAPGKTVEADGSSEIEFGIEGHVHLSLEGGDGREAIAAGVSGDAVFNLDADEPSADADLQVPTDHLRSLTVDLEGGDDAFTGSGIAGGGFFFSHDEVEVVVRMGAGEDVFVPGISTPGTYLGGPGTDTFSVRWLTCGSVLVLPEGSGSVCQGGSIFGLGGYERVIGTSGDDFIAGTRRDEVFRGSAGQDIFDGSRGADILDGGPGGDGVGYGSIGHALAIDLATGIVIGAGNDELHGIEDAGGTMFGDTLLGNARANRLWGSGGNDELAGRGGPDSHDGGAGRDDCHQRDAGTNDTFVDCER
jgi:Ca2+-binding RTX toxin-like protein